MAMHRHAMLLALAAIVSDPRRDWNMPTRGGKYDDNERNPAYTDEVHTLTERYERALYPDRREQLRDRLLEESVRNLPLLVLTRSPGRFLVNPRLRGWQMPARFRTGEGLEYWYFEKE